MDFATLRVFKAVVDEGGISSAARKLHRVQSNVTKHIQHLEASLGAKLFVRDRRRLFLSPMGELYLGYVEKMLELSDTARAAVSGNMLHGVFRIGTLQSTAASRLPPLLCRFHEKHPAVRVELTTGTEDELVDQVLTRKVEAAFVADCALAADRLELMPAFAEELVIIAARSHPKIRRARDVRTDTIIGFPSGCAYRRHLQAWLAADGVVPDKALDLSSYHAIVACVASGSGIALAPRSVLESIRATKAITVYPLSGKPRITTSLVWRKGETSFALKALQAELKACSAQTGRLATRGLKTD